MYGMVDGLLSGLLGLQLTHPLTYLFPWLALPFPCPLSAASSESWDAALTFQQWW